ncbi:tripartite tricarboxylate transporter TctB family protein [Pararhizobium sp. IMCC21322]|uniref:tripartite tricarboxylate transporter TctB family protein n=1 Tax=Pararhizobium sp. IMCC21322 TaxID=3067903 RepID=UPI002741CCC7|nr:tripartite tricarboxylate transporter TctB family protein [Pararhizobium sp. IMCC21322]
MRDIVSGALLTVFSALMYWCATLIENPGYDLLGPGFFPKLAVMMMGVLSAMLLCVAVFRHFQNTEAAGDVHQLNRLLAPEFFRQSLIVLFLGIYVFVLISGLANFEVASLFFVLSAGAVLAPLRAKSLIILGVTAVLAVSAISYTFRSILFVNLP